MQVTNIKYKDYIKEICNTYSPLNWLLKIFSLNSPGKIYKHPYLVIIKYVISAIILGCLNMLCLYYKFTYIHKNLAISVMYTNAVQMIYDVFQYTIDLVFVYKYGAQICFEYVKQYAYIDGLLGQDFYATIKGRLIKIMTILIFMWLSSSIFDYIIWAYGFGFIPTTAFAIAYVYMFIKILTNLDMTVNVMQVETRLRALAEIVQDCYSAAPNAPGIIEDVGKRDCFCQEKPRTCTKGKLRSVSIISCLNRQEVTLLSRCYLLLIGQIKFINKMFGIRILMNSVSLLIDMVRFTNLTVLILLGSQPTGYEHGYFAAVATFLRALVCFVVIISLVDHCDRVYKERERLICLLDNFIVDKDLDIQLMDAFSDFRNLVQSRTINFHMANFVRIEYPLLVSITSVVVTYSIILLQNVNNA